MQRRLLDLVSSEVNQGRCEKEVEVELNSKFFDVSEMYNR